MKTITIILLTASAMLAGGFDDITRHLEAQRYQFEADRNERRLIEAAELQAQAAERTVRLLEDQDRRLRNAELATPLVPVR